MLELMSSVETAVQKSKKLDSVLSLIDKVSRGCGLTELQYNAICYLLDSATYQDFGHTSTEQFYKMSKNSVHLMGIKDSLFDMEMGGLQENTELLSDYEKMIIASLTKKVMSMSDFEIYKLIQSDPHWINSKSRGRNVIIFRSDYDYDYRDYESWLI